MNPPAISVILPTHAPDRARLGRVLEGLRRQEFADDRWELLVVDNASLPPLEPDLALAAHRNGRVLLEPRLGSTHARARGLAEARGEILVCVDDDNVLAPGYLAAAADLFARRPEVAAAGGIIEGEFSAPVPDWARPHLESLAIRDFGPKELVSSFSTMSPQSFPYFTPLGAGLVVRRDGAERYRAHLANRGTRFAGRVGRGLGSAEDSELIHHAAFLRGREVAYSPRLQLRHLIPARRLKFGYLARLNYQGAVSWTQFLCHYGLEKTISSWSLPPRLARAFVRSRGWTRSGFLQWCAVGGRFVGRTSP